MQNGTLTSIAIGCALVFLLAGCSDEPTNQPTDTDIVSPLAVVTPCHWWPVPGYANHVFRDSTELDTAFRYQRRFSWCTDFTIIGLDMNVHDLVTWSFELTPDLDMISITRSIHADVERRRYLMRTQVKLHRRDVMDPGPSVYELHWFIVRKMDPTYTVEFVTDTTWST